jgi:WD40 repeat protein
LHTLDCNNYVNTAHFSPDGTKIVTVDHGFVKLWNSNTGEQLHAFILYEHPGYYDATYANFSPNGTKIISANKNGTVIIWNASSGTMLHMFQSHDASVNTAQFSPDGSKIVTASRDTAQVWEQDPKKVEAYKQDVMKMLQDRDVTKIKSDMFGKDHVGSIMKQYL